MTLEGAGKPFGEGRKISNFLDLCWMHSDGDTMVIGESYGAGDFGPRENDVVLLLLRDGIVIWNDWYHDW